MKLIFFFVGVICASSISCSQSKPKTEQKIALVPTIGQKIYDQLSLKFSDVIIIKSIFANSSLIRMKIENDFVNFYNLESMDSICEKSTKSEFIISKIDKNQLRYETLDKWCSLLIYFELIISSYNEDDYVEEKIFNISEFSIFKKKYIIENQTIDSLTYSQSRMIVFDFINLLASVDDKKCSLLLMQLLR